MAVIQFLLRFITGNLDFSGVGHYDEIADIMRKKAEAPALASDH